MPKGDEITTRFKVDISDLKAGINDANQQIKLANAEFKAATAGMDDWAKSADGVKAKLSQLESTLSAQKTKLEAYSEELKRQQSAFDENGKRAAELKAKLEDLAKNGVEKNSAEYKKYESALAACEKEQESNKKSIDSLKITVLDQQAAVNKTEAEINKYSSSLDELEKDTNSAEKETADLSKAVVQTGESARESSDGFTVLKGVLANLVASGIKAAISGLRDLGRSAIEAWQDFDEGTDTLIRMTGATGDMAKSLTASYSEVSKRIVASSTDIGNAVGEVNTRFGLTGEELENLSERYLQFAEITGSDVISSIDQTQKALSAYGLSAQDAGDFLDVLARTSQTTGVSTDKLAAGLVSNATAFQEMGLSVDQAVKFMGQLETSGANSETVLNGMRKALKSSADDGLSLNEALINLEDTILNSSNSVDGLTAAYDVFGKSGDQIYGAIAAGSLSFKDLAQSADDAAGTVENTFNATKDASDSFKLALQNIKMSAAEVIDKFLQENGPELEALLQKLSDTLLPAIVKGVESVTSVVEWIIDNIDWLAPLAGTIAGIATAIGVVTAAQTALNAVLAANPIGLVITAIAGLVAAFTALWNSSEEFREFWIKLWEKVKEVVTKVWEGIKKVFSAAWEGVKAAWTGVGDFFKDKWEGIKNAFSKTKEFFKEKFESARDAIKNAWDKAPEWFAEKKEKIQNAFAKVDNFMGEKFGGAWEAVKMPWKNAVDWFKTIWDSIKKIFSVVKDVLSGNFDDAWKGIKGIVDNWKNYFLGIWEGIKKIFEPVGRFFSDTFEAAKRAVIAPINFIIRGLNTLINGVNKVSFDVPDWVPVIGGKKLGFNIPNIPELARGGILGRGQIGLLEGSGSEAVVPLEKNKYWVHAVASDLLRQIQLSSGGSVTNIGGAKDIQYTQIINAPKAPSRIEIYRQTRNLLEYAKATGGV